MSQFDQHGAPLLHYPGGRWLVSAPYGRDPMEASRELDALLREAPLVSEKLSVVRPSLSAALANGQKLLDELGAKMARVGPALATANKAVGDSVLNIERKAQEAVAASASLDDLAGQLSDMTKALSNMGEQSDDSSAGGSGSAT